VGDLCVQERRMRHIASGIERLIGHAYDETDEKKGAPPPINRKRSAEQKNAADGVRRNIEEEYREEEYRDIPHIIKSRNVG